MWTFFIIIMLSLHSTKYFVYFNVTKTRLINIHFDSFVSSKFVSKISFLFENWRFKNPGK